MRHLFLVLLLLLFVVRPGLAASLESWTSDSRLTVAQQALARDIVAAAQQRMRAVDADNSLTAAQKRASKERIERETRTRLDRLLVAGEAKSDGGIGQGPAPRSGAPASGGSPAPAAHDDERPSPAVPSDAEIPPAAEMGPPPGVDLSSDPQDNYQQPPSQSRQEASSPDGDSFGYDQPVSTAVSVPVYVPYPIYVPWYAPRHRRSSPPSTTTTVTPTPPPATQSGPPATTPWHSTTYPPTKPWGGAYGTHGSSHSGAYPSTKPPTSTSTRPSYTPPPTKPSYTPPARIHTQSAPTRPSYSAPTRPSSVSSPSPRPQQSTSTQRSSAPTKPTRSSSSSDSHRK